MYREAVKAPVAGASNGGSLDSLSVPRQTQLSTNFDSVFGPVTRLEAESTVSNVLEHMVGPQMFSNDLGDRRVNDAFLLLKSNPFVKRAVVSAVCDETVLRAVANNPEVQNLLHSLSKDQLGDPRNANGGINLIHDAPKIIGQGCICCSGKAKQKPKIGMWLLQRLLDIARAVLKEVMGVRGALVHELFHPTTSEKQPLYDGHGSGDFNTEIAFMVTLLSIIFLVVILLTRAELLGLLGIAVFSI